MSSSFVTSQPFDLGRSVPQLRPAALRIVVSMLLLVAMLLAWRRLAGALAVPLELASLVAAGIALAAVARLVRIGCQTDEAHLSPVLPWIAFGSAVFIAAALSIPGTTLAGLALLWAPFAVDELWYLRRVNRPAAREETPNLTGNDPQSPDRATSPAGRAIPSSDAGLHVWHVQERATTDDQVDRLAGWIDVSFQLGQRTQVVHLAFCPPFAEAPKLSLQITPAQEGAAQHTQLLPFGARLEVKLRADAAEATQVRVQFLAEAAVASNPPHRESSS